MTFGDLSVDTPAPRNRAERRSAAKGTRRRKGVAVATGASVLLGGVQLFTAAPASAATFTVTTGADVVNGSDGVLSLREAVTAANGSAGADTITFDPSITVVTVSAGSIGINTDPLTIDGPAGRADLSIVADSGTHNGGQRLFYLGHSGDTTFSDLTISGASAGGNGGSAIFADRVNLVLDDVVLSGNTTTGGGGVLWFRGYAHDLTITDSLVSGNHASAAGGALYVHTGGSIAITGSTFDHNSSLYDGGAAYLKLRDGGSATIGSSTFDADHSDSVGGAVMLRGDTNYYGAPSSSTATISDVTFTNNDANYGGAVATRGQGVDLSISGGSMSGNSAAEGAGAYLNSAGADLTVSSLDVHDNDARDFAGGLEVITSGAVSISGTTFDGNTAGKGGAGLAFWPRNGMVADISDSTFVDNVKGSYNGLYGGGGLSFATSGMGGGTAILTVSSSTFQDNQSNVTSGGAIDVGGSPADVTITNSTLTGNTAALDGGAIHVDRSATLSVVQSTVTGNHADRTAGGIKSEATVSVSGSVVSGDTSPGNADLATSGSGSLDVASSLVASIPSGVTDGGGNLVGVDPQLGTLGLHGGTTKNFEPASTSPVRNAGPDPFSGPSSDQRGHVRVNEGRVDIGSVELDVAPPATTTTTTPPAVFVPEPTTTTTTPPTTLPPSTPPTTTPPPESPPAPPSVPSGGSSSPVFVEDGEVKEVPLPKGAPPNQVTAAVALSPTESIAVTADGRVFTTNPDDNAGGIPKGKKLNAPIVGLGIHWTHKPKAAAYAQATEDEWEPSGYWLLAADGGVFSFGTAAYHGSTGARKLNAPIVGLTPTATGNGYYLVAADGGVFSFGDARFLGSTGARKLAKPIVSLVPTPSGHGYWLVAADGGVFSFGDAPFLGSGARTGKTFVGAIPTASGDGYWLLTGDGTQVPFGDAR